MWVRDGEISTGGMSASCQCGGCLLAVSPLSAVSITVAATWLSNLPASVYPLTVRPVFGWDLICDSLSFPPTSLEPTSSGVDARAHTEGGAMLRTTAMKPDADYLVAAPTSPPHRTGFPDVPVSP